MKRKKICAFVLVLAVLLGMTGCAERKTQSSAPANGAQNVAADPVDADPLATEDNNADSADPDEPNLLIAYFSWSGHTAQLAEMIQQQIGGDLFAIEPAEAYTEDYDALLDQAKQEQADNARPALAAQVEDWAQYDTIFVGYPNWWGDAPMIVLSFLESYDCTDKQIIAFCTSGGGGFGSSLDSLTASAPGAEFLEGFHVDGDRVSGAQDDMAAWLERLGLSK